MHRCAKGRDEDGAGWGGSMAPINGLIIPATQDATPCWEEIQKIKEEIPKNIQEKSKKNTGENYKISLYRPPRMPPHHAGKKSKK